MFSFFKKRKTSKIEHSETEEGSVRFLLETRSYLIDGYFEIKLPVEFVPYENSDKFRAKTADGKKMITIANRGKKRKDEVIGKRFFEELKLGLYELYVNEGGYEAYDDLLVTDRFIRKSFKVDEETQYCFTSARIIDDDVIITEFIVREIGPHNPTIMPMLEVINDFIKIHQA